MAHDSPESTTSSFARYINATDDSMNKQWFLESCRETRFDFSVEKALPMNVSKCDEGSETRDPAETLSYKDVVVLRGYKMSYT